MFYLSVALLVVFAVSSVGDEAKPALVLGSDKLSVDIAQETGNLVNVLNKLTETKKAARDRAFEIVTDRGVVSSDDARLTDTGHDDLAASFTFESGDLTVALRYRVPSRDANFVEKLLAVTNRGHEPVLLDTVILLQTAFFPPATQVHLHTAGVVSDHQGVSPDVPINIFLRDQGGGLFAGIENPYFNLARTGNVLSLQYRPRWLLKPGETFVSDPAFLGVYKSEGIYFFKRTAPGADGKPPVSGAQEILDWGEVWAVQDFMRSALTADHPPGEGFTVIYNACAGMENLLNWRDKPESTEEQRALADHFGGKSAWTREIVHGAFRPAWIEPFRILIDHLAEIRHVDLIQPGTLWLGNGGFWDADRVYLSELEPDMVIEANPYWLQTLRYALTRGMDFYGFERPAWHYFPERKDLKYVGSNGKFYPCNCYANQPFVRWHLEAMDRAVTDHRIPWWQWDEGWADHTGGECYAVDHDHPPGNISYLVYRNIQHTTSELKRRHPGLWLVGISAFQHHCPWILSSVDESVVWVGPYYAHNSLFVPPGKIYVADYMPLTGNPEYDLLHLLSISDHLQVSQPIWFTDPAKRKSAQAFWHKWLSWADDNIEYLRIRRDLFGPPGPDALEGSAHILGDRGFVFLFNQTGKTMGGSIPLNRWIGLTSGERFAIREIYPRSRDYGVYAMGDELVVPVDDGAAMVLAVTATEAEIAPAAPAVGPGIDTQKAFLTLKEILPLLTEDDLRLVP